MNTKILLPLVTILLTVLPVCAEEYHRTATPLPDLKMEQSGLAFKLIEGYQDYRIVATHFRTDKNELRYVLANAMAFNALTAGKRPLPEGSKIVKIGWSVKTTERFPAALEADELKRVEYMYKESSRFNRNGDHWGYARFVKNKGRFESWKGDTTECAACHSVMSDNDYLFTTPQSLSE